MRAVCRRSWIIRGWKCSTSSTLKHRAYFGFEDSMVMNSDDPLKPAGGAAVSIADTADRAASSTTRIGSLSLLQMAGAFGVLAVLVGIGIWVGSANARLE